MTPTASLESESAFLARKDFSDLAEDLSIEIERAQRLLAAASADHGKTFGEFLPPWLNAWSAHKAKLNSLCKVRLGYNLPPKIAVKEAKWLKRRLLADLLQRQDVSGVREILAQAEALSPRKTKSEVKATSVVKTPKANAALKAWGQLSLEEFLAGFDSYDPQLVSQAAKTRGIKGKLTVKKNREKLHAEAQRFFENTAL